MWLRLPDAGFRPALSHSPLRFPLLQQLGVLLVGFFYFYARLFPIKDAVIRSPCLAARFPAAHSAGRACLSRLAGFFATAPLGPIRLYCALLSPVSDASLLFLLRW